MRAPILYEVNTRCWVRERKLSVDPNATLATMPDEELDRWKEFGFTHIWLMGVWKIGKASRRHALTNPPLRKRYDDILPGWIDADIPGSPYAISDYTVDSTLGNCVALKRFRERLHERGMKLILDFVPNHLDRAHEWTRPRPDGRPPELFVCGKRGNPGVFRVGRDRHSYWLAYGKDPYFDPWVDTVQLDYRNPETRARMRKILRGIADQCDGVRCDMAMLVLNEIFANTWRRFPSHFSQATSEFWSDAIGEVKHEHPDFIFLAEAYWDLEETLQNLGFDFTYDKRLCDALLDHHGHEAAQRLSKSRLSFTEHCAHFLENHDERRVAAQLSFPEHRTAALLMLALPGMRFLHDGQLAGNKIQVPVQMGRRPQEDVDPHIWGLYASLLKQLQRTSVGRGKPAILSPVSAWEGNTSSENIVLIQWQDCSTPNEFDLVVVNLAAHACQCFAPVMVEGLAHGDWCLRDLLGTEEYVRPGSDLEIRGLYLDVPAHAAQLFHFEPSSR